MLLYTLERGCLLSLGLGNISLFCRENILSVALINARTGPAAGEWDIQVFLYDLG